MTSSRALTVGVFLDDFNLVAFLQDDLSLFLRRVVGENEERFEDEGTRHVDRLIVNVVIQRRA